MRPQLVERPRLLHQLDAGLQGGLTLVSAPAGFGKTTLVADWLRSAPRISAWHSLDEGDYDPARFFAYLLAALRGVDERIGQSVHPLLGSPQPTPAEALLTALINDVAAAGTPCVLVLDDYHAIHTLAIHRQLSFLLNHLPRNLHFVLCSREDPPVPLSRQRAAGQKAELRQAELALTPAEAARFLNEVMLLGLTADDVQTLHGRTENQIGGLGRLLLWVMAIVGGSIIPLLALEAFLGPLPKIVPHYWANRALDDLMLRGLALADVSLEMVVLLAFSVAFLAIGLWRFEFE